jgi:hypothetical protein
MIATLALGASACGGDDDDDAGGGDTEAAAAPDASTAFDNLSAALEGQGLTVVRLRGEALKGAESGVKVTGDKTGTGLRFSTQAKADAYADEVTKSGSDKTKTVGTVVFAAPTQDDANFFAFAYEGG